MTVVLIMFSSRIGIKMGVTTLREGKSGVVLHVIVGVDARSEIAKRLHWSAG